MWNFIWEFARRRGTLTEPRASSREKSYGSWSWLAWGRRNFKGR